MEPDIAWSRRTGLLLDVETREVSEGAFMLRMPSRSSNGASVPGFLIERGSNLGPIRVEKGKRLGGYAPALRALAERWTARTRHLVTRLLGTLGSTGLANRVAL